MKNNRILEFVKFFLTFMIIATCLDVLIYQMSEKDKTLKVEIANISERVTVLEENRKGIIAEEKENGVIWEKSGNMNFEIGESVPLPSLPTHVKVFMDYQMLNQTHTPHYRLQQSAYTDSDGLRRFNEDYIVAMGQFHAIDIGERFKVTLDTGVEFTVITGDSKAPADCDKDNMYAPCVNYDGENCANVLEFIVAAML